MELLPTLLRRRDLSITDGDKASASATTTTMGTTICSSATSVKMFCTTTTATAHLPTSPTKPALAETENAGTPAAHSLITIEMENWTCLSPITSTSISQPRQCPNPAPASTRA